MMSASTATNGRPVSRTEITAPPFTPRRIERSRSAAAGGLRNAGTDNPASRATAPIVRTARASSSEVTPALHAVDETGATGGIGVLGDELMCATMT